MLKYFLNSQGDRESRLLKIVGACAERKFSILLRFENGFDIRNMHHFMSKKVSHTISQIVRVTEIEQFRINQLM